ncbi:long-chain fatty acid--CoA ligase [Desulfovibrio sp. OttesenSCG-928-F07]|nr:long-chain fatty acid--CoA ligase [Desulfovibrio sp. OttesenSCG-928-F07]
MTEQNTNYTTSLDSSLYAPEGQVYAPWLKSYDRGVSPTINLIQEPLYYWLDQAAEKTPERIAIAFKNYKLTYRQTQQTVEIMAANLRANGIQPGDRVSIMLPNLPQTILAFWAVLKAGGVVVFTNPLYMETELVHQINDSEAKCMITADLIWPKVKDLRMRLGVKKYFVTSVADALNFPLNVLFKFKERKKDYGLVFDNKTVQPFTNLLRGTERLSVPVETPDDTLACLQYTGGTTGVPKGAMLTHSNFNANIQQVTEALAGILDHQHNFLAVLPLFHVYGLTTCLLLPAAVASTIYTLPRFNPIETMQTMEKYKITLFPGAPSVYVSLLQSKDITKYDLSSLELCISGSAPMPVEYIKQFEEKVGGRFVEGYGLTEASPITNLSPLRGTLKPGSIGLPLPATMARIVDMELGTIPLPPGQTGELIIKGQQVMKGYWKRPDESANVLRNGWLYTGDIAVMDEDGYVFIVDRKKDMVIVGGYNVYPREVDEVLFSHPKVKEAVSVGIPHKTRGEILKAYIVLKPGETMTRQELIAFCRDKLANYKIPKQVEFRDELPKSMVGKILRRTIRSEEEEKLKSGTDSGDIIE